MRALRQRWRPLHFLAAAMAFMPHAGDVRAGTFNLNWGTAPYTWAAGATGPVTITMADQFGFQLNARMTIARIGGAAVAGYPDDLSGFGTNTSLWLVWDANSGSSGIGEATNTATLQFLNGGTPFAPDALEFQITDIDATDNNQAADRCDFVTVTGNAGNPVLAYVHPVPADRSVRIGVQSGSGVTGTLAANQAQCIYNTGSATSPISNGDDFGSVLAQFPAGTHTATVAYDESIENIYGVTSRNAAARGIGVWGGTVAVVNNTISLAKSTTATSYTAAGQVISYSFTVTNNGPLPINTGQNIVIQDDRIGAFTCGTISAPISVGGTHSCSASYTVTAGDMSAPNITNNAVAGVGTGSQSFATRLQSGTAQAVVPNRSIDAVNDDFTGAPIAAAGGSTATVFTNDIVAGAGFTPGAVIASISNNGGLAGVAINPDGTIAVPAGTAAGTWPVTYRICVAAAPASCDTAVALIEVQPAPPSLAVTKTASAPGFTTGDVTGAPAGTVITYTYVVTNTGGQPIANIFLSDLHNGNGPAPAPAGEAISLDAPPVGDSSDAVAGNGVWSSLAPGDAVNFTGTYTVTQQDVDLLQ